MGTALEARHRRVVFEAEATFWGLPTARRPAASTIHAHLVAALDGNVTSGGVHALSPEALRSVGLTVDKANSLHDPATKMLGGIVELSSSHLSGQPTTRSSQAVVTVRRIGRRSATMFFIFQPRCLNVWRSATTEPAAGMAWRGISLLPDHASSSRRAVRRAAANALTRSGPRAHGKPRKDARIRVGDRRISSRCWRGRCANYVRGAS